MEGNTALDTLKSFKEIMPKEDFIEFLKSEDSEKLRAFPEVAEFVKAEMGEDDDEGKKKDDDDEGKKKDDDEGKKKDDDDQEKSLTAEFMKSFGDELEAKMEAKFEAKLKGVTEILKSLLPSIEGQTEIKKSIDSIEAVVFKMAGMPMGTKAIKNGNVNFFEKSFGQEQRDETGKEVLSVTANKEKVLQSMEKAMSATQDNDLIKSYEDSIMRYNAGGGSVSQEVAIDLFEKHNIRLVR